MRTRVAGTGRQDNLAGLEWFDSNRQTDFYDAPDLVKQAVDRHAGHFEKTLVEQSA